MKYTPEKRLAIGKRIYENELKRYQAANEYGISEQTARSYMRMYRKALGLQPKKRCSGIIRNEVSSKTVKPELALEKYESMTKEELILELVRSKIREARLKKGYEVKGDGAEKVFIPLSSKNTK